MRRVSTLPIAIAIALAASLPARPLGAQAAAPAPAAGTAPQAPAAAPAPIPFVKADAEAAVADLAQKLDDNFVFPDVAKQYSAMLRANLAAGKYSSFRDARAFAQAVTNDLQAVHKDGHLKLMAMDPNAAAQRRLRPRDDVDGVTRSGWIADGVAYIEFSGFPGNEATITDLRRFLAAHKDAKTLIIDARGHRGGGLDEMNVMFPQIFPKETVLVDMDTRQAVFQRNGNDAPAFTRIVAGPEGVVRQEHYVVPAEGQGALSKAKVYLLVSRKTGSAGEHLALALKRTHRATLIGESTYGAGHYGGFRPIGNGFVAFIPVGRTFDPDTNQGWEGTGVQPDIAVPADQALDEALKRTGVKAPAKLALASLR
jgi:Peptidase family S41/N-terminal domain of Peptidase_S41 in eukaryotic IRBP